MQPGRGIKETWHSGFQQNHREVPLVPQVKAGFPQLFCPSLGSGRLGSRLAAAGCHSAAALLRPDWDASSSPSPGATWKCFLKGRRKMKALLANPV